jgi:hypothetical protein
MRLYARKIRVGWGGPGPAFGSSILFQPRISQTINKTEKLRRPDDPAGLSQADRNGR